MGVGGGGDGRSGESSRPFDIIMVHYGSLCYTRGQREHHLALIEASVL